MALNQWRYIISIFPDFSLKCQFSMTQNKISWLLPGLEYFIFPDHFLTCGNHVGKPNAQTLTDFRNSCTNELVRYTEVDVDGTLTNLHRNAEVGKYYSLNINWYKLSSFPNAKLVDILRYFLRRGKYWRLYFQVPKILVSQPFLVEF